MRRLILAALVAVVMGAPAEAAAQGREPGERPGRGADAPGARRGPLQALLSRRAELSLTAEQVARLEAVAAQLEAKNRPLAEQIRAGRPALAQGQRPRDLTAEQREQWRASRERNRPLLQQLRDNGREARQQAQQVLTEEQRTRARQLMRAERDDRTRGDRGRRGDSPRRGPRARR